MSVFNKLLGGSRRRIVASATAALLALAGIVAITVGVLAQHSAPTATAKGGADAGGARPSTSAAPTAGAQLAPSATASSSRASTGPVPVPAEPTGISISAIGVRSEMFTVGQNPDGTIHVPQPGPNYDQAAWYRGSPRPGEVGPSVILGHIDSAEHGPSVFFRLGAMQQGQQVSVTRADGTVAVFTVDKVEQYDKDDFPTLQVYGNTDRAELRLITCGGVFNDATGNYESNVVVYAHLTGTH